MMLCILEQYSLILKKMTHKLSFDSNDVSYDVMLQRKRVSHTTLVRRSRFRAAVFPLFPHGKDRGMGFIKVTARLNQNWNPTHSSLIALMNLLKRPWSLCESVITLTIERNMQLLSFRNAKYSILFCVRILVVEKIFRLNIKSLSHLARRKNKA